MAMGTPNEFAQLEQKSHVELEELSNGQDVADEQEVVDSGLEDATTASLKLSKHCIKYLRCAKQTCLRRKLCGKKRGSCKLLARCLSKRRSCQIKFNRFCVNPYCLSKTKVCKCYKMTCSWQYRAKCRRHHVTEQSVEDTEMEQNEFDEDY